MTGITVPETETTLVISAVMNLERQPNPETVVHDFFQTIRASNVSPITQGPQIGIDVAVTTIGNNSGSVTSLSSVATGNPLQLPVSPGGGSLPSLVVNGTFIINQDYIFGGNVKFFMQPNSTIQVTNFSELSLLENVIIEGCHDMWNGIEVLSGELTIDGTSAQTNRPIIIKDARAGVTISPNTGGVSINECAFRDNRVGITNPSGAGPSDIDLVVTNSTFETQEGLMPPFSGSRAFAGIQLYNVEYVAGLSDNTYRDMNYGIYAYRTTLATSNDFFQDLNTGVFGYGAGDLVYVQGKGKSASNPTFENCGVAISTLEADLYAFDNGIVGARTGISARNFSNPTTSFLIDNNHVEANSAGIKINNVASPGNGGFISRNKVIISDNPTKGRGLSLQTVSAASVEDNDIEMDNGQFGVLAQDVEMSNFRGNVISLDGNNGEKGFDLSKGRENSISGNSITGQSAFGQIGLKVSSSPLNDAACNCISNLHEGAYFYDDSRPFTFRGNTFGGHSSFALKVGAEGGGTPQVAYMGEQEHQGNTWEQTFSNGEDGGGNYADDLGDLLQSQFVIHTPSGTTFHPPVLTFVPNGDAQWFRQESGSPYACPPALSSCAVDKLELLSELDIIKFSDIGVADGTFTGANFPDAQTWKAKRHLYRRLRKSPSLIQPGSVIETFFNTEQNTSVGMFDEVEELIATAKAPNASIEVQLETVSDSIIIKLAELVKLEKEMMDPDNQPYYEIFAGYKATFRQEMSGLQAQMASLQQTLQTDRSNLLGNALNINNDCSDEQVFEHNQKVVNQLYIEAMLSGKEYTSSALRALKEIALQCPLSGGDAVYQARAILDDEKAVYDDELLCGKAISGRSAKKGMGEEKTSFSIYPNPALGFLNVDLDEPLKQTGKVLIFDTFGRLVLDRPAVAVTPSFRIELPSLAPGLYRVDVTDADGKSLGQRTLAVAK